MNRRDVVAMTASSLFHECPDLKMCHLHDRLDLPHHLPRARYSKNHNVTILIHLDSLDTQMAARKLFKLFSHKQGNEAIKFANQERLENGGIYRR